MQTLLTPLNFFVWHPGRCVAMAAVFVVVAIAWSLVRRRFVWSPVVAAVGWLLFAWMEHYCRENGMNIRVDLFFTGPIIFAVTLYGVLGPMRKEQKKVTGDGGEGTG
jgi:hypothetical protein